MIVAIPTMQIDLISGLLANINLCNTSIISEVLIYNNSGMEWKALDFDFDDRIEVINCNGNIGVNPTWNMALERANYANKHLLLMNDDVYLSNDFFVKLAQCISDNPKTAVYCPATIVDFDKYMANEILGLNNYAERYSVMTKREGWAFTINRDYVSRIPPISSKLNLFFGDDWIWFFTGGNWVKDNTSVIYHKVGGTTRVNPKLRAKLRIERGLFAGEIKRKANTR